MGREESAWWWAALVVAVSSQSASNGLSNHLATRASLLLLLPPARHHRLYNNLLNSLIFIYINGRRAAAAAVVGTFITHTHTFYIYCTQLSSSSARLRSARLNVIYEDPRYLFFENAPAKSHQQGSVVAMVIRFPFILNNRSTYED